MELKLFHISHVLYEIVINFSVSPRRLKIYLNTQYTIEIKSIAILVKMNDITN